MIELTAMEVRDLQSIQSYRSEQRFAAQVQQIVAYALNRHGPINPDRAERDAYDIAMTATAMLLRTILEDDAELRAMKQQVNAYRKMAERSIALSPVPLVIFNPAESGLGDGTGGDPSPRKAARDEPLPAPVSALPGGGEG